MTRQKNHIFKICAVVKPINEIEKLKTILALQEFGYCGLHTNWRNNINGENIIISYGQWFCTDNDTYKKLNNFANCENDIDKFLEIALEKN